MTPSIFLDTAATTQLNIKEIAVLISVFSMLISIGSILFSAGILKAQVTQNKIDIVALKSKELAEQKEKLTISVQYEKRLTSIETKVDTVLKIMQENIHSHPE